MIPSQTQDLYARLEIDCKASPEEIKKSYRIMAHKWHPDKNLSPWAKQQFEAVSEAYTTLKDPVKREEYDKIHWIFKGKESPLINEPKKDIDEILKICDEEFNNLYNIKGEVRIWSHKPPKIDVYV